jgi:hypothetical protein
MRFSSAAGVLFPALIATVDATRPFLNEPDTGAADQYGEIIEGSVDSLPTVDRIIGLQDFEYVARDYMNISSYTYYRAGKLENLSNLEAYVLHLLISNLSA